MKAEDNQGIIKIVSTDNKIVGAFFIHVIIYVNNHMNKIVVFVKECERGIVKNGLSRKVCLIVLSSLFLVVLQY